jgi:hypothetical protein
VVLGFEFKVARQVLYHLSHSISLRKYNENPINFDQMTLIKKLESFQQSIIFPLSPVRFPEKKGRLRKYPNRPFWLCVFPLLSSPDCSTIRIIKE